MGEGSLASADPFDLKRMARLLAIRNLLDEEIASLVGRPAEKGHVAEWIAHRIFGVTLADSAVQKGFDGRFADGPLAGKTVDVKYTGLQEAILSVNPDAVPDYYLALTGPKPTAVQWATSKGQTRPFVITQAFLFDGPALVERLRQRGVQIGAVTSVRTAEWDVARVFPTAAPGAPLTLSVTQREALARFAGKD